LDGGVIVMDDCVNSESNSIIAAGACCLPKEPMVASGSIYAGMPARK